MEDRNVHFCNKEEAEVDRHGGSKGIGLSLAVECAMKRANVTVIAHDDKMLKKGLENILPYLDAASLKAAELVCKEWLCVISEGMLWKKLIERKVNTDPWWGWIAEKRGWNQYLINPRPGTSHRPHSFYRELFPKMMNDIKTRKNDSRYGIHRNRQINCRSGFLCLQFDDVKIVSGHTDYTIKIWARTHLNCVKTLTGHTGAVLCLQFDDKVIISGSVDSTVRVWDVINGEMVNTLIRHSERILHLRFNNGMLVTCSNNITIAVWDMTSPTEITLRRVLVGHRAIVNVVDFDEKYIVSACRDSRDCTIKVWSTSSCEFVRTLEGHMQGIACLQYRDRLVVSGSSDHSIRLWHIECGTCLRVLEGHKAVVSSIRFDYNRIISGAGDGEIKVWDLDLALVPTAQFGLCLNTLEGHKGLVNSLQFDEFQMVSGSFNAIVVWDFLKFLPCRSPSQYIFCCSCGTGTLPTPSEVFINHMDEYEFIH